jgi:hypothetical protein
MVAWPSVCRPTELGGLGISDLKLAGYALQTRWLWLKKKTDGDRAWSQLPIRTCPQVQAFFNASTFTVVGDGLQALFWENRWINGEAASDIAPSLYLLVSARTRRHQTVRAGLHNRTWAHNITYRMSTQAIIDYLHLWNTVADIQLSDQPDRTGEYSAKVGVHHVAHRLYTFNRSNTSIDREPS